MNLARRADGTPSYQVVAALAGRGFAVRREDMRNLLLATRGKVFTLSTIRHIVSHTDIARFATKEPAPEPQDSAPTDTQSVAEVYEAVGDPTSNDNLEHS